MSKLLTIAIPAYNSESYLRRCLDSLVDESIMDLVEVIVVNDGSKDNTSKIAHEYGQKYKGFFRIIDKENGNYGSVMNVALSVAEGKYFKTLDSDDWYDKEGLRYFISELSQSDADYIMAERITYYESENKYVPLKFDSTVLMHQDVTVEPSLFDNPSIMSHTSVTCICYKTCILRQSGLKWSEGVFYSDAEYDYWALRLVKKIRFVGKPVYVYLIGRKDQSMSIASLKRNFNSMDIVVNKILNDFLADECREGKTFKLRVHYLAGICYYYYQHLLFNDQEVISRIRQFDSKVSKIPEVYEKISKFTYHRIKYAKLFGKRSILFHIPRIMKKLGI